MKASTQLIDFIARHEGFRDTAYQPVPGDDWTIGYGSTIIDGGRVKKGDIITQQKAEEVLTTVVQNLAALITKSGLPQNITQNQFDAVVSLVYNIGYGAFIASNTDKMFKSGQNISQKILEWNRFHGSPLAGLTNRRLAEQAIYDRGDYSL